MRHFSLKKWNRLMTVTAALVTGLALGTSGAALAAELHPPHLGSSCPEGFVGTYHFVNNQVPAGSRTGHLNATWTEDSCSTDAYKVNRSVQHFLCVDKEGALTAASTNLGGKLVLSDFTCTEEKKDECVPEKEVCDGKDNDCDGKVDEGLYCKK
jgi:hypothetical protein